MINAGAMIRKARLRKGLTQVEVSRVSRRSATALCQLEKRGDGISFWLFEEIMNSMGYYEVEIVVREAGKRVSI